MHEAICEQSADGLSKAKTSVLWVTGYQSNSALNWMAEMLPCISLQVTVANKVLVSG